MAAYASLVCLSNILEQNLQLNLIPRDSRYIEPLLQEASFFQDFLEKSSNKSNEPGKHLESRIRDAAYKAQNIIESHVANRLDESVICLASLFQDLDEVMEEIKSTKLEAMQIREEEDNKEELDIQPSISTPAGSSRPPSHGMTTNTMVGLGDQLEEIKTRLVGASSKREIVALVGMDGIGKTTLAQKVYNDKSILSHFDICGWTTVSQEHNVRNILLGLLDSMGKPTDIVDKEKLKEVLYKSIKYRRYFIVLDDMWDTQVWDELKRILANDENGSRILLTSRLKKVAEYENNSPLHHVRFLNDEESWGLFCETVFGHDCCPLELEEVGKEIVRNCRGLPLEVNVIGGHLSKATRTPQYWRSLAKNLSETVASEGNDQCSSVLSLSYKHLSHHLKGCFLYMSIFPEDYEIAVSRLVHLWIANGLIKEERSKSFEDVANDYFLDLVERNLILVSERDEYNGKILHCKIHDLIRDLCSKEAKSEKFHHLTDKTLHYDRDHLCYYDVHGDVSQHSRPLRALYLNHCRANLLPTMENQITNIRFLNCFPLPTACSTALLTHKFLHLQTIYIHHQLDTLNIWEMTQLRHVKITPHVIVPDPPATKIDGGNSVIVPEKLQTLSHIRNLNFTDEVLQRIQKIRKLGVQYVDTNLRDLSLNNLKRLHQLESLKCFFSAPVALRRDINFPLSIKKLTLLGSKLPWKDMTVVGSLPNLQVFKLKLDAFVGEEWEPNEGEFLRLKTLHLEGLYSLVHWRADADHFPVLEHLFIQSCNKLQEIPCGFAEIPTLQLIDVCDCGKSVDISARKIEEEQHNFGNEGFRVKSLLNRLQVPGDNRYLNSDQELVDDESFEENGVNLMPSNEMLQGSTPMNGAA